MANKLTKKSQLIADYLTKYPKTSIRTLADKLMADHPLIFTDHDQTRTMIRKKAGLVKNSDHKVLVQRTETRDPKNPFNLPDSHETGKQIYRLPKICNNILWLSDIHFPNHSISALTAALQFGKDNGINCIVLGGDILDNVPFTRHDASPVNKNDAKLWFNMASEFIDNLKKIFNCPIYWIEGNHDKWYERWLMKAAPMIWDDEYFSIESRLGLKQRGVTYLKENIICKAGKLDLLHGHTLIRGVFNPVNPARGAFMRAKSSVMIGHCHQTSEHSEQNLKGELITCYSTGCLCELSPVYDPHNGKHNHGFAVIRVESNGNYHVTNKRIINGVII